MTPRYHVIETEWGDVNCDADWYDREEAALLDKVYPPYMDRAEYAKGVEWLRGRMEFQTFVAARMWAKHMRDQGQNPSQFLWSLEGKESEIWAAKPCPFCAKHMLKGVGGTTHPPGDCLLAGHSLKTKGDFAAWNRRGGVDD